MKIIVIPDASGLISVGRSIVGQPLGDGAHAAIVNGQTVVGRVLPPGNIVFQTEDGQYAVGRALAENQHVIDVESADLRPYEKAYLREDGTVEIVYDYRSNSPWFDQNANTANRLKQHAITALGIVPPNQNGHPVSPGWENMAMTPRAETNAERNARQAAEAQAALAVEAQRRANRVLSPVQFRLAASQMGIRDDIEALVANPATPQSFKDYWEYATEFRRSSPLWPQALQLMNKTEADLDQLYDIGEAL